MENILTISDKVTLYSTQAAGIYTKSYLQFDFDSVNDFYQDLTETVFAFGNTEGGHIVVLKTDLLSEVNSQVMGKNILSNCASNNPFFNIEEAEIDDQLFFYVQVNKSAIPLIHQNGNYYKRKGPINQAVKLNFDPHKIKENEIRSIEYEREIVTTACYDDLDEDLIREIINNSRNIQIKEPKRFLQQYNLIEAKDTDDYLITKAALLLFSRKPKKWHPNIDIRFTQFKSDEFKTAAENIRIFKDETEEGNILTLLRTSWDKLRPFLTETTFISKDKLFKTQVLYPEDACIEALLNAIAHRDYSIQGRCIEIRIFEDKLEVISPGGLLSTINIQDLRDCKGVHESRNPIIARTLREIGYMRELGEGIKRIYETLRQNDLQNPELEDKNSSFEVTLFHRYVYTNDEKKYLLNFSEIELTKTDKDVIRLGVLNKPLSRNDIMNAANLKSSDDFQKVITPLQKKGLVKNLYSQVTSRNMASRQNIEVRDLPRFLILLPGQEAKYDTVKNENIFKNNPTCVIFQFLPLEISVNEIKQKLTDMKIEYEILKTALYEDSHSVSFNLKNSDIVRTVIESKENIIGTNSSIKVFPSFKDEHEREKIRSNSEKEVVKEKDEPKRQINRQANTYFNKNPFGYKIPMGYKIPENFTNCNVKVKNMPANVDEQEMIKFFQQFGKVIDITIDKNVKNQIYLKFEEPKSAHFLISKSGIWTFKENILMVVAKTEKLTPDN